MIVQLGIPELGNVDKLPRNVDQVWVWEEDREVMFMLTQSPKKFGVGGTEPAEVCGRPGAKGLIEAEDDHPEYLLLAWNDGDFYYSLGGTLAGPLTEEILIDIACSVRPD